MKFLNSNISYYNISKNKDKYLSFLSNYKNLQVINIIIFKNKKFKSYMSSYIYSNLSKKIKTSQSICNNLFSYSVKSGNFNKNSINNYSVFSKIYSLLFSNGSYLYSSNYKYAKEFLYNFYKYSSYNNFNFLLNWIISWIKPIFFIDCTVVPKKYRKKIKKKYLYKVKYLSSKIRINKSLKWIQNYKNSLRIHSIFNRELFSYLDLLLNYKLSYVYLKKIIIYKKIFKV